MARAKVKSWPIRFLVRPEPRRARERRWHLVCEVHRDKRAMREAIKKWCRETGETEPRIDDTLGRCSTYEKWKYRGKSKREKLVPEFGRVWFCWGHLGVGLVSHEMTHAALGYLDFVLGWELLVKCMLRSARPNAGGKHIRAGEAEERYCQVHYGLVRGFYVKMAVAAKRRGLKW